MPGDATDRTPHLRWMTGEAHVAHGDVVVHLAGELDGAARDQVLSLCTSIPGADVRVDLSQVTFMDSAGHEVLMTAQERLEAAGGTLELVGVAGEPARLIAVLDLVADAD